MRKTNKFIISMLTCVICLYAFTCFATDEGALKDSVLYYRFSNTSYIAPEERKIFVSPSASYETELLRALVKEPSSVYPHFSPLFPDKTDIITTWGKGNLLFVTFNEHIMDRYTDEYMRFDEKYKDEEGMLRRKLAMAALSCTVTENTNYAYVQVLVKGNIEQNRSMRLSTNYFLSDENKLINPLYREESYIITPDVCAKFMFDAWKRVDFAAMQKWILNLKNTLSDLPILSEYSISRGTCSPGGKTAILMLNAILQSKEGITKEIKNLPIRLIYDEGIWRVDFTSIKSLIEVSP
ncbi:MAG TPA: GerMN domain-containing protein [Christensenellaceae bacterium]|nr:GerMN domain-containing protein [Christensenellaceae bacterium]